MIAKTGACVTGFALFVEQVSQDPAKQRSRSLTARLTNARHRDSG